MRIGNQYPTQSFIIPYDKTNGDDAIKLYEKSGKTAQEWQSLLIADILALNEDDLYTHSRFGYSLPRRNGKNEIVAIREMYGLTIGEHIIHTAHRTTATHVAWERLYELLTKSGYKITSSFRAYGREHIEIEDGGKIEFRTRTSKGGLGEGYDLLVVDEAQEYTDDQETALKYVVSDSKNPQILFCGTPPTTVSAGTIFQKLRKSVLQGKTSDTGWAEWSIEKQGDPNDVELWYLTNPSLGTILTERKIRAEIGNDDVDFNIQRLGLWYETNLKSAISLEEWQRLEVNKVEPIGKLYVGIKYGSDGTNVSMSIAVKTQDKIFVECIGCKPIRDGNSWIINFLKKASIEKVIVDGANGQSNLAKDMKDYGLKTPLLPTVKEIVSIYSMFEQAILQARLIHSNQPSVTQSISNCDKRAIGTNGGFGYKSLNDLIDVGILETIAMAYWLAETTKAKQKQKISY